MENTLPKVSFVLPTLNSESTLDVCLRSIIEQKYPYLEIVIVDGGSKDSTVRIASKYTSKILHECGPLGRARHVGVDHSDGEILGIFDSDTVLPSPTWLQSAVKHFIIDKKVGIVWPINKAPKNASLTTRCYFNLWSAFLSEKLEKGKPILPGGNSLILRRAFDDVGGFNIQLHFGEDLDLSYRIILQGYRVIVHEEPILHNSMRSIKEFLNKQIRGALTLMKAQSELDLMYTGITWTPRERSRLKFGELLKDTLVNHVFLGLKAMFNGLMRTKDKSWIMFPIFLFIRLFVYGSIFLASQIKLLS